MANCQENMHKKLNSLFIIIYFDFNGMMEPNMIENYFIRVCV
jgi:hypothetical protein